MGVLAAIAEYDIELLGYKIKNPQFQPSLIGDFNYIFGSNFGYNNGSYASAAAFSFLVSILYVIHAGLVIRGVVSDKMVKNKKFLG